MSPNMCEEQDEFGITPRTYMIEAYFNKAIVSTSNKYCMRNLHIRNPNPCPKMYIIWNHSVCLIYFWSSYGPIIIIHVSPNPSSSKFPNMQVLSQVGKTVSTCSEIFWTQHVDNMCIQRGWSKEHKWSLRPLSVISCSSLRIPNCVVWTR